MLSWLFPSTCPVDEEHRLWIESRAGWIVRNYPDLIELPVRLPLREDFPDPYERSHDAASALMRRIQSYLGLGDERIRLAFYREGDGLDELRLLYGAEGISSRGTAGTFHGGGFRGGLSTISINEDSLASEIRLAATLAHELGHFILLVRSKPGGDLEDHEPLTDLLTIFSGFGIFTANCIVYSSSGSDGLWTNWQVGRLGYLSAEIAGYALALYAKLRGEPRPKWRSFLSTDPRAYLEQSRRFLNAHYGKGPLRLDRLDGQDTFLG